MAEAVVSEVVIASTAPLDSSERVGRSGEQAARITLRRQIAHLEAELSRTVVRAFEMRGAAEEGRPRSGGRVHGPRLLDLGELERIRDELATRLREAETAGDELAERQAAARALLSQMQLEPGHHRFTRIPLRELGEPGCGVWHVRPRLGLIGMLAGWWQVTLSSGCPLATCDARTPHRHRRRRPAVDHGPRLDRALGRHPPAVAVDRVAGPGAHAIAR
jgi:hypothetical protein